MNRRGLIPLLLALVLVLVASACGGHRGPKLASRSTTPHHRLRDLHDLSELRTAFNTASKRPRLIVLVSPT